LITTGTTGELREREEEEEEEVFFIFFATFFLVVVAAIVAPFAHLSLSLSLSPP
jgi:hypothetical protein